MKMKDLKPLVTQALKAAREKEASFKGVDHPQVRESFLQAQGAVSALEDVLEAINGNTVFLRARGRS